MGDVIGFPVARPRSGPVDNVAIRGHSRRRILDALHALHTEAEAGTTERLIVKLLAAVFQEHGSEDMLDKLLSEVEAMDCLARLVPAKFEPAESSRSCTPPSQTPAKLT
jgi:hypothetical protein